MKPDQILRLFPEVVRRTAYEGSVLSTMVNVMSHMHEPVEDVLATFGEYVDPYRCPDRFVPMLMHWVGLGWLLADRGDRAAAIDDRAMRELVVHAAELAKVRGTRPGLERMLTLATSTSGFTVANAATPFAIDVRCPESVRGRVDLVTKIVQHEKPAFVTASLLFDDDLPLGLDWLGPETAIDDPGVRTF